MNNQTDLHAAKAAEVLGKPVEEVTKEERRMGKTINFGLDYAPVSAVRRTIHQYLMERADKDNLDYNQVHFSDTTKDEPASPKVFVEGSIDLDALSERIIAALIPEAKPEVAACPWCGVCPTVKTDQDGYTTVQCVNPNCEVRASLCNRDAPDTSVTLWSTRYHDPNKCPWCNDSPIIEDLGEGFHASCPNGDCYANACTKNYPTAAKAAAAWAKRHV